MEIVESLETNAVLNALHRFLCLSGNKTRHIRADCATTFIVTRNTMSKEMQQAAKSWENSVTFQNYLQTRDIIWEFSIPANSHHQGGVLGADNKKRIPSDFELITLFRETEYVMNCRPLGRYSSDEDDVEALRPIDLITGFMEPIQDTLPICDTKINDKFRRGYKLKLKGK